MLSIFTRRAPAFTSQRIPYVYSPRFPTAPRIDEADLFCSHLQRFPPSQQHLLLSGQARTRLQRIQYIPFQPSQRSRRRTSEGRGTSERDGRRSLRFGWTGGERVYGTVGTRAEGEGCFQAGDKVICVNVMGRD